MNIFILDDTPTMSAIYQCDKHVVKMILESAQMLSTAHHILDEQPYHYLEESTRIKFNDAIYRPTHKNHPCSVWVRESKTNYLWLWTHFQALCKEYTYRYGKTHLTETKLLNQLYAPPQNIPDTQGKTPFRLCMPDKFKGEDPIKSYRAYYRSKQNDFKMTWKAREIPEWFSSNKER